MQHHRLFRSIYHNRIRQFRIKRDVGTVNFEARPEPGVRESPLPLIFVRGTEEYDWNKVINYFSAKGYGGVVVDVPPAVETVDDATNYLEEVRTKHGLIPPIMITFGLTTFIGQKYLESYPLHGLIMVNPLPPYNYEAALRQLDHQCLPKKLVESLLSKKQNVLLEPGMLSYSRIVNNFMSVSVIFISLFRYLAHFTGAVRMLLVHMTYPLATITEEDIAITTKYHALDAKESVVVVSTASDLFRSIHDWIEEVL